VILFIHQSILVCIFLNRVVFELKIWRIICIYWFVTLEQHHFNLKNHGSVQCAAYISYSERIL
jgi:hypothetical protein